MTTFNNQSIGSFDDGSREYVQVWYDETLVSGFSFHSVGCSDVMNARHYIHGVSVEARHIWAAIDAFNNEPTAAFFKDGKPYYCTTVWLDPEGHTREIRRGNKHGEPIARMVKTGYIQQVAA